MIERTRTGRGVARLASAAAALLALGAAAHARDLGLAEADRARAELVKAAQGIVIPPPPVPKPPVPPAPRRLPQNAVARLADAATYMHHNRCGSLAVTVDRYHATRTYALSVVGRPLPDGSLEVTAFQLGVDGVPGSVSWNGAVLEGDDVAVEGSAFWERFGPTKSEWNSRELGSTAFILIPSPDKCRKGARITYSAS
ncbi:MAG: hypothetical protein HY554_08855 [Elusimicrobia bacterium]|nr:hypothetical protein [Elusimicrobiota bacterium]